MLSQSSMRGNALFIILIAVALFAALSYAITKGGRGSAGSMEQDRARIVAAEMIQYGNMLRGVVDRMILLNGVLDTNTPAGSGILFNVPGSGSSPLTREVFDTTGGGAPYTPPPADACLSTCAYTFTGQITVTGAGNNANPELSMILVSIPETLCKMINVTLGLGATIPTGSALTTVAPFTGTNYGAATAVTLAIGGSSRAMCYKESSGSGRYIYVNVIRAR